MWRGRGRRWALPTRTYARWPNLPSSFSWPASKGRKKNTVKRGGIGWKEGRNWMAHSGQQRLAGNNWRRAGTNDAERTATRTLLLLRPSIRRPAFLLSYSRTKSRPLLLRRPQSANKLFGFFFLLLNPNDLFFPPWPLSLFRLCMIIIISGSPMIDTGVCVWCGGPARRIKECVKSRRLLPGCRPHALKGSTELSLWRRIGPHLLFLPLPPPIPPIFPPSSSSFTRLLISLSPSYTYNNIMDQADS